MLNLQQFNTFGRQMTIEEAKAQLEEIKRLAVLKAKNEKSEKKLKKVMTPAEIQAQAQRLVEYEAKRAKMLAEYNHYITYRADKIPITKINNKIDKVSKHATMIIDRNNQPLSLTVYEKFVLKKLGFGEWIKVHTLASKNKSKANDIFLKNLKAKFECIKTQARKLGIPPPPKLTAFGLSVAEKKRKRSSEIIKEVFIKDDIVMDEMNMNLIPPPMVKGSRGLVIREPESGIFFDNGNFDLLFQREEEFHLATTSQLIRIQSAIQRSTPEAEEMFKKIELTIEARNDVTEARRIASTGIEGFVECKTSASNLKRIQVKDIVKEVEDYLKTYSSARMDISWYVVPTGRVKVPAGRYVVPTGKDKFIVSAGRTKVIPAGSTILVLVVLCLLRVDSMVS
ncbi:hypothetical protein Tco_0956005 [Tanacetum coccineum]|uniref:Uncharacterized protein n=1 Tax=Tanacetum coccineum TaxID=301880 RepID=A0ABQ5E8U3_9ASTR